MAIGASAGFSGVTIPQFQKGNGTTLKPSENSFQLTDDQLSWFASLPTFATIPTCIFGGLMGQAFGRRLSLLLVAPIFVASFICQAVAQDVVLLQCGPRHRPNEEGSSQDHPELRCQLHFLGDIAPPQDALYKPIGEESNQNLNKHRPGPHVLKGTAQSEGDHFHLPDAME